MPTGPRTPSTDSGVCAISPTDLVGHVGNLINRVKDLEQQVAELQAQNTEVNQLSDISQQIGWIGGLTYLGTSGWTRTAAGTMIPPPGMSLSTLGITMSDGNSYQMVTVDENGVLQFGFTATGAIAGAATNQDYMTLNTLSGSPGGALTLGTVSASRGSAITLTNSTTITISTKGVYAYNLILSGSSADIDDNETFHLDQDFGYPFTFTTAGDWAGVVDESNKFFASGTQIGVVTTVPCTVQVLWNSSDDPGAGILQSALTIVKLQHIT